MEQIPEDDNTVYDVEKKASKRFRVQRVKSISAADEPLVFPKSTNAKSLQQFSDTPLPIFTTSGSEYKPHNTVSASLDIYRHSRIPSKLPRRTSFSDRYWKQRRLSAASTARRKSFGQYDTRIVSDFSDTYNNDDLYGTHPSCYLTEPTNWNDTYEALPHADHYRNKLSTRLGYKQRPTMGQLHEQIESQRVEGGKSTDDDENKYASKKPPAKFGWIQGVLVRCLLNIFGVMLFLRLTWITGQAGIGLASLIVVLSSVVTIITTMSMSAICTNGEVRGGGAYYMISRSLGPEFGGAIGIVFSLANAVAAAMYVVGFAETVVDLMKEHDMTITGNVLNDIRIIGCVTSVILIGIVIIGMEWEAKAQVFLLFILLVAIVNYVVGTVMPVTEERKSKGFVGYSSAVLLQNLGPDYRNGHGFFDIFSVFFPASTGILAGANISGDLKNPQTAIPKGTLLAIGITSVVYLCMVWLCGATTLRDVGMLATNWTVNTSNYTSFNPDNVSALSYVTDKACLSNHTCPYGLQNDYGIAGVSSAYPPIILAGIFSATLSSALASLVGAPKVFQAVCKDKLFPFISVFAKGYGRSLEPRRGYLLAFGICLAITCIAELNVIAPIISNFFLMAYMLINFACFYGSISSTPGFRPGFTYYNKWLSLIGSMLCLSVMFVIKWWSALVTFVIVGALCMYVRFRKPDVNWGSSVQAHAYVEALKACFKLNSVEDHVKNFRPQILVLTGDPRSRPNLVDFVTTITKKQSLLICGHVLKGELLTDIDYMRSLGVYLWFKDNHIKSFYSNVTADSFSNGGRALLQTLGLGKMRPNVMIMGFKSDWKTDERQHVIDYFHIIHDALDMQYGVGILRVKKGFEIANTLSREGDVSTLAHHSLINGVLNADVESNNPQPTDFFEPPENPDLLETSFSDQTPKITPTKPNVVNFAAFSPQIFIELSSTLEKRPRFRQKQSGTIDVWWLYDDGGLTLLVPYIISHRALWKDCKLRVFCVGTHKGNINEDQRRVATLLSKFRIDFSHLTVLTNLQDKPKPETYKEFEEVIKEWVKEGGESPISDMLGVSDTELKTEKHKTHRHLRLREEMLVQSSKAALIVLTLPVPRKSTVSVGLYMAWLEMLTRDMPPILLLRGNQQSVLTYYS